MRRDIFVRESSRPPLQNCVWLADLWDFCNARRIFYRSHIAARISCSDVTNLQQGRGPSSMSIDTLLVILVLTFGVGVALHHLDLRRHF
jgi:hypothetical protein